MWPFLGLYGLWLWFGEPHLRLRMVVLAALIPALWFLPEWWGSGDPFRAGARANNPNPGSAAFAEHPALELRAPLSQGRDRPGQGAGSSSAFVLRRACMWLRRPRASGDAGASRSAASPGSCWWRG